MRDRWRTLPEYAQGVLVRLAFAPLVFFIACSIVFLLTDVAYDPQPATIQAQQDDDALQRLRHELGLDRTLLERYRDYWVDVVTFDFGNSFVTNRPVRTAVRERIPRTGELVALAAVIAGILIIALGALSRIGGTGRVAATATSIALASLPVFGLTAWAITFPFMWWDHAPPTGAYTELTRDPLRSLREYLAPAVVIGLSAAGWLHLFARAPHTHGARTGARSLGRESLLITAYAIPFSLSAALFAEVIFTLPGMLDYTLRSALTRDAPSLHASFVVLFAISIVAWVLIPPPAPSAIAAMPLPSLRTLMASRMAVLGAAMLASLLIVAVFERWLRPYDPMAFSLRSARLADPSASHLLGTDRLGRDILSRVLHATGPTLRYAVLVGGGGAALGAALGAAARVRTPRVRLLAFEAGRATLMLPVAPLALAAAALWRSEGIITNPVSDWPIYVIPAVVAIALGLVVALGAPRSGSRPLGGVAILLSSAAALGSAMMVALGTGIEFFGFGSYMGWGSDTGQALSTIPYRYTTLLSPVVATAITTAAFLLIFVGTRAMPRATPVHEPVTVTSDPQRGAERMGELAQPESA
jgi:peptide/nickel transport system permease protein